MTYLQWKPDYSVGVASIDAEHQEMIELINTTYEKIGDHADPGDIEEFLGEIFSGISAHFALEEQVMKKAGYGEYQAHKENHEKLLDQIRDMMDSLATDPDTATGQLQQELGDWFANHFATFDARLHHELDMD